LNIAFMQAFSAVHSVLTSSKNLALLQAE